MTSNLCPRCLIVVKTPFSALSLFMVTLASSTITKQFVDLMGGTIKIDSKLGAGSCFSATVPVDLTDADEISKIDIVKGRVIGLASGQPTYRVLIVEDQPENALLLKRQLEDAGFVTQIAEDGAEAVARFETWKPQFIWMDRHMPVMDGLEATRRIRRLPGGREVKIAGLSASAFSDQPALNLSAGMDDFVRKPYRFDEIYDCLSRNLGMKFLYRTGSPDPIATTGQDIPLLGRLVGLPAALREEFKVALESLDSEHIATVIQRITDIDTELGRALDRLAISFNYPAILHALRDEYPDGLANLTVPDDEISDLI